MMEKKITYEFVGKLRADNRDIEIVEEISCTNLTQFLKTLSEHEKVKIIIIQ